MTLRIHPKTMIKRLLLLLLPALLAVTFNGMSATASDLDSSTSQSYMVTNVQWEQTADDFILRVQGDSIPTYTMYELFDPLRIIIDIADGNISDSVVLPLDLPHGPVTQINGQILGEKTPAITRIEVFLSKDEPYAVEREENDILVSFAKEKQTASEPVAAPVTPAVTSEPIQEAAPPMTAETAAPTPEAVAPEVTPDPVAPPLAPEPPPPLADPFMAIKKTTHPSVKLASLINAISVEKSTSETRVYIKADGPVINYENVPLQQNQDRPDRMYIDIEGAKPDQSLPAILQVETTLARIRTAPRENGIRIVFDSALPRLFTYDVASMNNGLLVVIQEAPEEIPKPEVVPEEPPATTTAEAPAESPVAAMVPAMVQPSQPAPPAEQVAAKPKKTAAEALNDFSFSGYTKKRITVDFYKIDLHNVFRLFGEISGLNIVVDQSVNGSLTLALNDVPWDFALDIIMNLKDLQKEERYNTLVISPKSKMFAWPKKPVDNIAFKADEMVMAEQEKQETKSIKVTAKKVQPLTVVESKKLILLAQGKEKVQDYTGALELYEDAFSKWPDNGQLANRIASLCLVQLGMNAKATHYAKAALQINPDDREAALQAAIGLANMKKRAEATEYFDFAVNTPLPTSDALASYSAFQEENRDYSAALALLLRHESFFGDTLDTMISKARLHDKMGNTDKAIAEYRAILLSGFDVPPDLLNYINGRIALANN